MEIKSCKFLFDFSHKILAYHNIDKERADYIIDLIDAMMEIKIKHDLFQDLNLLKGQFGEYHEFLAVSQIMTALCIYNKILCSCIPKEELQNIIDQYERRLICSCIPKEELQNIIDQMKED